MELKSTASKAICGNLEIMENILGFLHECDEGNDNPRSPSYSSLKDLFATCLVSKAFLDPALNILWRHLESLLPLLYLFPTFQENERTGHWFLTGTIHNNDLQRVLFYSRRIRSIRLTSPSSITADTLTILFSRMQPLQPFLPLTELIFEIYQLKTIILNPFLFIMPLTLTTISIIDITPASRIAAASLLQHLSSDHKSLKYLTLTGSLDDAFLTILLECTSLRSLTLTSSKTVFTADYLEQLSDTLASLESLSLNQLESNETVSTGATFPPTVFPSLLDLTLTGDLTSISSILSTLKAPLLREITLSFSSLIEVDTPDAVTFAECVAQVLKIKGLERRCNLRSVKISHTDRSTCIDMSAFDALSVLRPTLQVLHLQPNQLLWQATKVYKISPIRFSYPNLVDLRLSFKSSSLPTACFYTIKSIASLARLCPNLKTLHISLGGGKELENEINPSILRFPDHGLQNLVVHHLPRKWKFSMPLAVNLARYLYYLFPILSSAEYCEKGMSKDDKEWWTGVQDMLKMCKGEEVARRLAASIT